MNYIERIVEIGKRNNGYVCNKQVLRENIPTAYLKKMLQLNMLEKVEVGIYLLNGYIEDTFYTYNLKYSRAVYCKRAALYLHGLTNRQLEALEATFPKSYNTSKVVTLMPNVRRESTYLLGKSEVVTGCGNIVQCYDKERCICDLFVYDCFDGEEKVYAIKEYKRQGADYDRLYDYADKLGVLVAVKSVMEVL